MSGNPPSRNALREGACLAHTHSDSHSYGGASGQKGLLICILREMVCTGNWALGGKLGNLGQAEGSQEDASFTEIRGYLGVLLTLTQPLLCFSWLFLLGPGRYQ